MRNTSRAKAFSLMFYFMLYLWSMKLAERYYVLKISYFLITRALLLELDPNPTLLSNIISQQKMNLSKSLGKPALEKSKI